jgi:hypothetical protein
MDGDPMIDDEVGAHTSVTVFAYWKFESVSLQGRVQCELPRTNFETKSAQTIPPPDRQSM